MIPAISMPRRDGRSSFEKLKEYLAFEPKAGTGERVKRGPMVLSDNLLSLDTAAQEMRAAASRNYVAKHPVMHFQLSWKPGEVPTEAQWLYAAKRSIEALGFAEHQFLIAAHDDKEQSSAGARTRVWLGGDRGAFPVGQGTQRSGTEHAR